MLLIIIAIGFAIIPANIAGNLVQEREGPLKHQQLISGMNLFSYWAGNFIFDLLKAYVPVLISLGLIYAFGEEVSIFMFNFEV